MYYIDVRGPKRKETKAFLARLSTACDEDRILVTKKAADEASFELGWNRDDIIDQLRILAPEDFEKRVRGALPPKSPPLGVLPYRTVDHQRG